MMEQQINKLQNWKAAVDIKLNRLVFLSLFLITLLSVEGKAQNSCDGFRESLDEKLVRLFTAPRHQDYRETEFPATLHNVLESEVRRLNFPDEQSVCESILSQVYENEPVPGHPEHRALYKIKDHFFLVIYSYYTDEQGNQLIEDPTVGLIFDPDYNRVAAIPL